MTAQTYRKKPVVIEAMCFDGSPESATKIIDWLSAYGATAIYHEHFMDGDFIAHPDPFLRIDTLEGRMIANKGDQIIKGVQDEFYPCKPDIFAATYEEVSPDSDMVLDLEAAVETTDLWKRRAIWVYEASRARSVLAGAGVPESWALRDPVFQEQFIAAVERRCISGSLYNPVDQHAAWMRSYFEMGWKYGPVRDEKEKVHPNLVPWTELPKEERQKDEVFYRLCSIVYFTLDMPSATTKEI